MTFEVLARTEAPNGFGKFEYILWTELGKDKTPVMAWTAKAGPPLQIGETLDLYGGNGSSSLYLGISWAYYGFEAALPHTAKEPRLPQPCSHSTAHFVLHLFQGDAVRPLQLSNGSDESILSAVFQQWEMFGNRYESFKLGEWQGNRFVYLREGEVYAGEIGPGIRFKSTLTIQEG